MKTTLLFTFISLFSLNSFAASYNCQEKQGREKLSFHIVGQQIIFSDVEYLGYAQILVQHPFPYNQTDDHSIDFEYDWYYTATYNLEFLSPLSLHQRGDQVRLLLSFDDSDGAFANDVLFYCNVR